MNSRKILPTLWCLICFFFLMRLSVLTLSGGELNPYLDLGDKTKTATFNGSYFRFPLAPKNIKLSADDCLANLLIDNQVLHNDPTCNVCKDCDQKTYKHNASALTQHSFSAQIINIGGPGGIYNTGARPSIPFALLTIFILGIILIRKVKDPFITIPTLALYLVVYTYFKDTDLFARQHDLNGHIEYIRYLLAQHHLPPVRDGWEYHQPPFYYAVIAVVSHLFRLGNGALILWAQYFGFAATTLAMFVWALIVSRLSVIKSKWLAIISFSGIPSLWYFSARINNDVLIPLLSVVILFAWIKMHRKSNSLEKKYAVLFGFLFSIAFLTKISVISLFMGSALASAWLLRKRFFKNLKLLLIAYLPGALTLVALFARTFSQTHKLIYVPSDSRLVIGNNPSFFLSFDLYRYLTAERANPWGDEVRFHFFENLFITFVSGEFSPYWSYQVISIILRILVLLGAYGVIRGIYKNYKSPTTIGTFASLTTVMGFVFLLYHRMFGSDGLGSACNGDARFLNMIYPSIALLIVTSKRLKWVEPPRLHDRDLLTQNQSQ